MTKDTVKDKDNQSQQPKYNIDDIKFSLDEGTYGRAVDLYTKGKVTDFSQDTYGGYYATVQGTSPYRVSVSSKKFDTGYCDCYLGQNNTLCKHMIAVAITALTDNGKKEIDLKQDIDLKINNRSGELSKEELAEKQQLANAAIRKIKYYSGSSSTWFAYQDSLIEGCNRLKSIFSSLPVSPQTCSFVVANLLKIDKKLSQGVDDSDGTVGRFITESVDLLIQFAGRDSGCIKCFGQLVECRTMFGWERPLAELIQPKEE